MTMQRKYGSFSDIICKRCCEQKTRGHFTEKWGIFSVYWEVMCPRHFSSGHFYAFSVIGYLYSENWMHLKYVRIFDVFSM